MTDQQNETPQRASLAPNWDVPKLDKLMDFDTVRETVQQLYDLRIEPKYTSLRARGITSDSDVTDDVIDLSSLQFSSAGQVQVPGQGVLEMTPWARQQLGGEIGVRWDKFFNQMEPDQIQSAVMNHLRARNDNTLKKVIARRHTEEKGSSSGILRAFVSPSYADIPDAMVLDRMASTVGRSRIDEMGFYAATMTDRGTFMSIVFRDAVNMLGDSGKDEMAYYGLRLRNSEVGAYSFVGDGYLFRLICTNGMIAGFSQDRWLYRRHHHIDEELLDALLQNMFERLIDGKDKVQQTNSLLVDTIVERPAQEIRSFMRRQHRPKIEQDAAVKAFCDDLNIDVPEDETALEPSTAYHVTQGMARLSMALRGTPERQHEVELLAGAYMRSVLSQYQPELQA